MAKKVFTDESLETLIDEIKTYTQTQLDSRELITEEDIDTICGTTIVVADDEVKF